MLKKLKGQKALLITDTDLGDVGDVLGVVGLDHDLVVVGPQDGGPHADGQVRGRHHVLLKQCTIIKNATYWKCYGERKRAISAPDAWRR